MSLQGPKKKKYQSTQIPENVNNSFCGGMVSLFPFSPILIPPSFRTLSVGVLLGVTLLKHLKLAVVPHIMTILSQQRLLTVERNKQNMVDN